MRSIRIAIFFLLLSVPALKIAAQQPSRSDLEKRRNSLLNEIATTQQELEATKKDKKATLSQLNAIVAKLEARQRLINTINTEMASINGTIATSTSEISTLNNNLAALKASYAQSIRYAYKHKISQNMLAFVFSANNFNDGLRRLQYLRKYQDYRKKQAEDIRVATTNLNSKINVLNNQKNEKTKLLAVEQQQKSEIQADKKETDIIVSELKGKEKELVAQIQQNQKAAKRIEASIKDQIKKEIEIARKKAEEEAKRKAEADALARKKALQDEANRKQAEDAQRRADALAKQRAADEAKRTSSSTGAPTVASNRTPAKTGIESSSPTFSESKTTVTTKAEPATPSYKLSLTPDAQIISNNFSANKGRLPWPVEKGFISGYYGKHPNKLFPSVTEENNGVDITTGDGASVKAVFEGTVTKVANIDGVMIMVNHGEFYTVYTKLGSSNVKTGDKVSARQVIGRSGKNDSGENIMNFQIWRVGNNNSLNTVNPSDWIAR
jgi:septal ring factor EnvC (AmiA/AmiB activator)